MEIEVGTRETLSFLLVDANMDPVKGATPVVKGSFDGGPFLPINGSVTEVGEGWYKVPLPTFTSKGTLLVLAAATGALPWRDIHQVVPARPDIAAIVAAELDKWAAELTLPIKLIRTGTNT